MAAHSVDADISESDLSVFDVGKTVLFVVLQHNDEPHPVAGGHHNSHGNGAADSRRRLVSILSIPLTNLHVN